MERAKAGFTLIEVMVGIVLVGLMATATASAYRATTNLLGKSALHARAIALAQGAMEDLRNVDYESIASGSSQSEDGAFTVTWQVNSDVPEPGMKSITLTTSWLWKGEPRRYEVRTIYSRLTAN